MESKSVREYFDTRAEQFDQLYGKDVRWRTLFNRTFRQAIYQRFTISLAESGKVQGARILDIGCGPGRYVSAYAQLGAAQVVGIDVAEGMIKLAEKHTQAAGIAEQCQLICGDFLTTDFADQFDVVLAVGVFDYLSKPEPFLRRMVELATSRVIVTFPGRSVLRMRLRRLRYAVRGVPVHFYRKDEVEALAQVAGLRAIKVVPIHTSGTGHVLVGKIGR